MIQTRVSSDEMKHIFGTNSGINPCFAVFCLKMMLPLFCAQEHAMTITVLFGFRTADKHISKPCMYLHGNTKLGMHTPSVKKKAGCIPVLVAVLLACRLIVKSEHPVDFSAKAGTCFGELCNQLTRLGGSLYIPLLAWPSAM